MPRRNIRGDINTLFVLTPRLVMWSAIGSIIAGILFLYLFVTPHTNSAKFIIPLAISVVMHVLIQLIRFAEDEMNISGQFLLATVGGIHIPAWVITTAVYFDFHYGTVFVIVIVYALLVFGTLAHINLR